MEKNYRLRFVYPVNIYNIILHFFCFVKIYEILIVMKECAWRKNIRGNITAAVRQDLVKTLEARAVLLPFAAGRSSSRAVGSLLVPVRNEPAVSVWFSSVVSLSKLRNVYEKLKSPHADDDHARGVSEWKRSLWSHWDAWK